MIEPTLSAPETLEGWYALHQMFAVPHHVRHLPNKQREAIGADVIRTLGELAASNEGGWTRVVQLVGSDADVMLMHFRPTLDDLGRVQRRIARSELMEIVDPVDTFLSVAEAGLYTLSVKLAQETAERGGTIGDEQYRERLELLRTAERGSEHVKKRLFPVPPDGMPYVCFYPMDKKREAGQNWYALPLADRGRMMYEHGLTGRNYRDRIYQVITGAIGFDEWEWGVTLFGRDPLDFKKLVSEMRFDEASAKYADFGKFYVGRMVEAEQWIGEALA